MYHNNTNQFANTSHNVSPPQDQFTLFPTQTHNFQYCLQDKIVIPSPQNNQPFVFTPQTHMFANLNIQATNLNNTFFLL